MPHPDIVTERLRLYPACLADLEAHIAMEQDEEVMRYVWLPKPPEELRSEYRTKIESGWPSRGAVFYVAWRDRPGFLGWVGIYPMEEREDGLPEIGYIYRQEVWGQGVATEAARAVMDYGFATLGLDPIVAVTDPDNRASQAVLTKAGLQPSGTIQAYGGTASYFVARRADWLNRQRGPR